MDPNTVTIWWQLGVMGIMLLFGVSSLIGWNRNKARRDDEASASTSTTDPAINRTPKE